MLVTDGEGVDDAVELDEVVDGPIDEEDELEAEEADTVLEETLLDEEVLEEVMLED